MKKERPYTTAQLTQAYSSGMTITELAAHFNISRKCIQNDCKSAGIKMRTACKRNQAGENNASWKGGKTKQGQYVYIRDPNHKNATKNGYVAEHIVIALKKEKRDRLYSNECVHHIDMDKSNNNEDNLAIQTRRDHAKQHEQLQKLAIELLLKKGVIGYDKNSGYYIKK